MEKFSDIKKPEVIKKIVESVEEPIEINIELSDEVKLFNKLIESKNITYTFHLKCIEENGYIHTSLDEYYNKISPLYDTLIEVYQAQYGLIGDLGKINLSTEENFVEYYENLGKYIKFAKVFKKEDTELYSVIDEILLLIYKTVFKLKYLNK